MGGKNKMAKIKCKQCGRIMNIPRGHADICADCSELPEKEVKETKEILKCDHCGETKLCNRHIYNKFGNVVFICDDCVTRYKQGMFPKVLIKEK